MLPTKTGVLIIGAGPTGLTVGLELARRGVDFLLVDKHPEALPWDRATVIHSRTLEIFDALGIADAFLERGQRMNGVNFFAYGKKFATLHFDSVDCRFPYDLNLSEQITEEILTRRLETLGGKVSRGWKLTAVEQRASTVTARLQGVDGVERTIEADWLVGADGLRSTVRQAIQVDVDGHHYAALWGVVDGSLHNWQHDPSFAAVQLEPPSLNPLPIAPQRWRVYFRAEENQPPAAILETINQGLGGLSPDCRLVDHDRPALYRTHRQLSRQFRKSRVLLAGDAAHACSPIEGHGMNGGIQDAFNLGWKLALVIQGKAGDELLDTYDRERRPVVDAMGASGDLAEQLRDVPNDRSAVERVKRTIMTNLNGARDRYTAALAETELGFRYEGNPITCGHHAQGPKAQAKWLGVLPGQQIPDGGPLRSSQGYRRLYDLLRQPGFVILWLATDRTGGDAASAAVAALDSLATVWFLSTATWETMPTERCLLDEEGSAHAKLGAIDPTLFVVRPDNRVGFRCEPPDVTRVLEYFRNWASLPWNVRKQ
jgi:2-polyprenyl-6-methoxyphenol hydroxylase-like FAD-dependent oxidoreductase